MGLVKFIRAFLFDLELRAAQRQVRKRLARGITQAAWLSWPSRVSRSPLVHPLSLMTFSIVASHAEYLSLGRDTKRQRMSRSHPKTIYCLAGDPSASRFNRPIMWLTWCIFVVEVDLLQSISFQAVAASNNLLGTSGLTPLGDAKLTCFGYQ